MSRHSPEFAKMIHDRMTPEKQAVLNSNPFTGKHSWVCWHCLNDVECNCKDGRHYGEVICKRCLEVALETEDGDRNHEAQIH